jgi:NAD(P)-dependent dehydrogenase (short-subunit alcohol dehydrogenase family)
LSSVARLTTPTVPVAAVKQAHDHFGRLDIVVNNAGYGQFGFIEELSEQEARDQIETNVFGALWITQAALQFLRAQRSGHIIQVSSIGGITAFQNVGIYHASKWALEGFSQPGRSGRRSPSRRRDSTFVFPRATANCRSFTACLRTDTSVSGFCQGLG